MNNLSSPNSTDPRRVDRHQINRKAHCSVAFDKHTIIHEVPSLRSYTDAEMAKLWVTSQDNLRIKEDMKRTVKQMQRGHDESTHDGLCTRGLEHMRDTNILQRLTHEKALLIEAVLVEQSIQGSGTNKSRIIAAISSQLSKRARDRAVCVARLDAQNL